MSEEINSMEAISRLNPDPHFEKDYFQQYRMGRSGFIAGVLPEEILKLPLKKTISLLKDRFGNCQVEDALCENNKIPLLWLPTDASPSWIKRSNMVGINVRTIGHFWNVVKYALTLPQCQDTIHLLPVWEPGVVSSLYGIASWHINPEFFSAELHAAFPHLDSPEKQLKAVINLLHLMGKAVGMDVIPHTDRYSEIVLANPHYFEWLQRKDNKIVNHSGHLHERVQKIIYGFLQKKISNKKIISSSAEDFFDHEFGEDRRMKLMFGEKSDYEGRKFRRLELMDYLYRLGYEPVPVTMAPPYRGLEVDDSPAALTVDSDGRVWRDYRIINPTAESRVFGPLTRYKFYESKNDNESWELDFEKPVLPVWSYFTQRYTDIATDFDFDFMRGDMAHVQMRAGGVPCELDTHYDPLCAVRQSIRQVKPCFAYFAETFLSPPDTLAYGNEMDHLEATQADATLGDLQSMEVGKEVFIQNFRWYLDLLQTRRFAPTFAMMTGDKDDPRFDKFYLNGNEARFFIGLFLPDMPSYMALGFECRDLHPNPAPNEHYTKLYVFKMNEGPKATRGPYQWGRNQELFHRIDGIRCFAEKIQSGFSSAQTHWLIPPDATGHTKVIAWSLWDSRHDHLFVVNLDTEKTALNLKIPCPPGNRIRYTLLFSTHSGEISAKGSHDDNVLVFNGIHLCLSELAAGEGRVYG